MRLPRMQLAAEAATLVCLRGRLEAMLISSREKRVAGGTGHKRWKRFFHLPVATADKYLLTPRLGMSQKFLELEYVCF
jgi:hypothetical protein